MSQRADVWEHTSAITESSEGISCSRIDYASGDCIVKASDGLLVVDNRAAAIIPVTILGSAYLEAVATERREIVASAINSDLECRDS